jgi:hypothetical protein
LPSTSTPRAQAKIHLRPGSRLHLHPHERDRLGLPQLPHETLHRVITVGKLMPPTKSWYMPGAIPFPTVATCKPKSSKYCAWHAFGIHNFHQFNKNIGFSDEPTSGMAVARQL